MGEQRFNPYLRLVDHLENRYTKRELARQTLLCFLSFLVISSIVLWYITSLTFEQMDRSWSNDNRTVLIEQEQHQKFPAHYNNQVEELWCIYGTANQTHIVIDRVIHREAEVKNAFRADMNCFSETFQRVREDRSLDFLGFVHSHPQSQTTKLSIGDAMAWADYQPMIKLMGIYVEGKELALYTVSSHSEPLDMKIQYEK